MSSCSCSILGTTERYPITIKKFHFSFMNDTISKEPNLPFVVMFTNYFLLKLNPNIGEIRWMAILILLFRNLE